jgi:2-polyprenyl-3-methyl-5-hydroxy-6-metoxy-1,4-benzoquinol methylase
MRLIMTQIPSIREVRQFWEDNPLWTGESKFPIGSKKFFLEHRKVIIADCFAGELDERIFPDEAHMDKVLDLGCGPGFWTVELSLKGAKRIVAADLTENALRLAKKRCEHFGIDAEFILQNAEAMDFRDASFSHVNCQGVIQHTPNTDRCIFEIARVLEPGGTANISVYHKNIKCLWT